MNNVITPGVVSIHAYNYMREHRLDGWTFGFNTNKRRLGVCKWRRKRIELSIHCLKLGWAEVEDTLKHEVAHALVGPQHKHDAVWAAKARELGCRAMRCGPDMGVIPQWIGTCPRCQKTCKRHKRKQVFCGPCNPQASRANRINVDPLAMFFPKDVVPIVWIVWTQNPEYQGESRETKRARRRHLRSLTRTI